MAFATSLSNVLLPFWRLGPLGGPDTSASNLLGKITGRRLRASMWPFRSDGKSRERSGGS
eukprot:1259296-Amphidinium_carterae.1